MRKNRLEIGMAGDMYFYSIIFQYFLIKKVKKVQEFKQYQPIRL